MYSRFFFACLVLTLAVLPAAASQGIILYPLSYSKPVPGGQYVFVMLGDAAAEEKVADSSAREKFRELRARYPKTGLYRADSSEAVWMLEESTFAPAPCVFVATDGVHLVRIDGDWWTTDAYVGGQRPSAEVQQRQLDGPGVTFFQNGKVARCFTVRELIVNPDELQHTPNHLLWYANGSLNEDTGRFLLGTQDSHWLVFDYRTGAFLERRPAGLANPLMTTILIVCGTASLAILAGWIWFAFFRKKTVAAAPSAAP